MLLKKYIVQELIETDDDIGLGAGAFQFQPVQQRHTIGHADDASQHLDDAAKAEAQQQAAIAGETVATLKASHEVVTNLNAITADGKEAADYEKKQITTPLTKMQRLGRSLEDFGAMVLGHLL